MRIQAPRQRSPNPPQKRWRIVKLVIGFDGTRYEGWQNQRKGRTVQEIFEKSLLKIFREPTSIVSSSRTDSGVHAAGLAAHFRTGSRLPDAKVKEALNYYLPRDILVHSARTQSADFHARYSAKSKVYRYSIWNSKTRPLFEAPYVLWHPGKLDVGAIRRAAEFFRGRHDFRAFMDGKDEKKSFVRMIRRLSVQKKHPLIRITVEADGFLRHMVRVIVGTLIEAGRRKLNPNTVRDILKSKDRKKAGSTAKPCGLTLLKVRYN